MGLFSKNIFQCEIEFYFKWLMRDADFNKTEHILAVAIATAVPKESVANVVSCIIDQLHHMNERYYSLWRDIARSAKTNNVQYYVHDLSTLYKVVIKFSVISLLTYDVAIAGQAVRCLSNYNFRNKGQDIWHTLVNIRRSSDEFLLQLYGGAIDWRAVKQFTVIISSIEMELLAMSRTAKKVMWWRRFFERIRFDIEETLAIKCDNRQIIKILINVVMKLDTKLRHINIHQHWLRQEMQAENISVS